MTTTPSTFGQPSAPTPAPEPEPVVQGRGRTVAIVVTAGVVALGVLGGAAALVLAPGGEDDVPVAAPPAPAAVEPSPEPSAAEVVEPLPVSAVRSRNIFVPLVDNASSSEEGEDEEAADGGSVDVDVTPVTDVTPVSPGGGSTGGGGGIVVTQPVDTEALDALRASEERVAQLEAEIADLQTRLEVAGDDSALENELADVQERYADLLEEAEKLADEIDSVVFVNVFEVDEDDAEALTLTLLVNGEERTVDLDPETDVTDSTTIATTSGGFEITVRYLSYDGEATPETVTLQVGSTTYTVSTGASLSFQLS
ncbi:hypothetical protein [Jannaschia sp. R86511]|uniref:hypothetical protein n=1 Tax=Jannaschia sp. R86511 TaxID=3093853 RepID=UPI0036D35EE9